VKRIVLAFDGDLNASVAVPWLAEQHRAEVVTVSLDLGEPAGVEGVRDRALALGAARAHVFDARDTFARDYLLSAVHAGALDWSRGDVVMSLGRAIVARHLVEIARLEAAAAVAHGCEGGDRELLDTAIRTIDASIRILAPAHAWKFSEPEKLEYARARGVPVGPGGRLRATGVSVSPDRPARVELAFERGVPVAINGVPLPLAELLDSLDTLARGHRIGQHGADMAPALLILQEAHQALQQRTVSPEMKRLLPDLARTFADLLARGLWFTPAREALSAAVATIQTRVSGTACVDLSNGAWVVSANRLRRANGPMISPVSQLPTAMTNSQ
jgi:argininosuccinate synthase